MELKDSYIWIMLIILVILTIGSLINIFYFMKVENKCEPAFKVINRCGCIPDQKLADLFKLKNYYGNVKINLSNLSYGN